MGTGEEYTIVWREGMGVEPTAAGYAPPATDFEDQGAHRDTSPPTSIVRVSPTPGKLGAINGAA